MLSILYLPLSSWAQACSQIEGPLACRSLASSILQLKTLKKNHKNTSNFKKLKWRSIKNFDVKLFDLKNRRFSL